MPPPEDAVDPHWCVADLLEHVRALATAATSGPHPSDVGVRAAQVQARCGRLEALRDDVARCGRRRDGVRLAEALDRLAYAADDLAAIALLRCRDARIPAPAEAADVPALLRRVGERHDLVVRRLQQSGIRRMYPVP